MIRAIALACSLLSAAAAQQAGTAFRLVRVVAGPGGSSVGGHYVLDEERSTFSRARDAQVVVSFEWEGTPGKHRLSATWRHLESASSSMSHIDYEARDRRFGAYWTLPLSRSTLLGRWRIEAAIDGLPAGQLEVDVVDAEAPPAPPRRVLSPAELYQRATASLVVIERLNALGAAFDVGAGFALPGDRIVTAHGAIDAAHRVVMIAPDGRRLDVLALSDWSRPQGWAVIPGVSLGRELLPHAVSPPAVGDRCYSIGAGAQGARVLVEGTVVGHHSAPKTGPRVLVSFYTGPAAPGAPVLNDFGEVIGISGEAAAAPVTMRSLQFRAESPGFPVVPIELVRVAAGSKPVPVADLVARGVLLPPVYGRQHVLSGGFATRVRKEGPATQPVDQRYEFSTADPRLIVFLTWSAQQRLRGPVTMRLYDEDNRLLAESKPKKMDLRIGQLVFSDWTMPVPPAGIYRVDVLLDGRPYWRDFFRVTGS